MGWLIFSFVAMVALYVGLGFGVKEITKKDFKFYEGDVQDKKLLEKIFNENQG